MWYLNFSFDLIDLNIFSRTRSAEETVSFDFGQDPRYIDYPKVRSRKLHYLHSAFCNRHLLSKTNRQVWTKQQLLAQRFCLLLASTNGGEEDFSKNPLPIHLEEINFYKFTQFLFFEQWITLKNYANKKRNFSLWRYSYLCFGKQCDFAYKKNYFKTTPEEISLKLPAFLPMAFPMKDSFGAIPSTIGLLWKKIVYTVDQSYPTCSCFIWYFTWPFPCFCQVLHSIDPKKPPQKTVCGNGPGMDFAFILCKMKFKCTNCSGRFGCQFKQRATIIEGNRLSEWKFCYLLLTEIPTTHIFLTTIPKIPSFTPVPTTTKPQRMAREWTGTLYQSCCAISSFKPDMTDIRKVYSLRIILYRRYMHYSHAGLARLRKLCENECSIHNKLQLDLSPTPRRIQSWFGKPHQHPYKTLWQIKNLIRANLQAKNRLNISNIALLIKEIQQQMIGSRENPITNRVRNRNFAIRKCRKYSNRRWKYHDKPEQNVPIHWPKTVGAFALNKPFTQNLTKWQDDRLKDKYDHNYFEYSQPSEEEFQRHLPKRKRR